MKRIQRRRSKGWRMPPNAIYVGRPSRWGNPRRRPLRRLTAIFAASIALLGVLGNVTA